MTDDICKNCFLGEKHSQVFQLWNQRIIRSDICNVVQPCGQKRSHVLVTPPHSPELSHVRWGKELAHCGGRGVRYGPWSLRGGPVPRLNTFPQGQRGQRGQKAPSAKPHLAASLRSWSKGSYEQMGAGGLETPTGRGQTTVKGRPGSPRCCGPAGWSWFSGECSCPGGSGSRWRSPPRRPGRCRWPASPPRSSASGTRASPSHSWGRGPSRTGTGCWSRCKGQAPAPPLHTYFSQGTVSLKK